MSQSYLSQDIHFASTLSTYCKSLIRISEKNRIIQDRFKEEEGRFSVSPETFENLVQKSMEQIRKRQTTVKALSVPPTKPYHHLPANSCFMWYILRGKSSRNVIPDYELTYCRQILQKLLKSVPKGELHFGYAKLCFHDEQLSDAYYHITESLKYSGDMVFKQWFSFLALLQFCNNHEEALNMVKRLESYVKERPCIENFWALMTLSLKDLLESRVEIELPHFYATQIKAIDEYYGYLAYAEIFIKENNVQRAVRVLNELVDKNPTRPEAYVLLWELLYKNNLDLEAAQDLMTRAFLRVTDNEFDAYVIIFSINLAKVYSKLKKFNYAFELLQEKFVEHPQLSVYLYHYGRLCIKAEDTLFINSGIAALQECLRLCDNKRYGKIYFWLAKAYFIQNKILEASECINISLEKLTLASNKKSNLLREILANLKPRVLRAENIQKMFSKGEIARVLAECDLALEFDKIKIIKAKCLWSQGFKDDCLKFLNNCIENRSDSLRLYFMLAKYLKKVKNFEVLNKITKKMIKMSKNTQIVTTDWMNSNIWYARSKSAMHKPDKALPLLQCLAKVFPPLPQYEIPYTKYLISAKTAEDFLSASSRAQKHRIYENSDLVPTVQNTLETSFDEHSPEKTQCRREFTSKFIEDSIDDSSFEVSHLMPPETEKLVLSHKSFDITLSRISDRGMLSLANGMLPTGNRVFVGFSVSSECWFLYYISKICMDHDCNFEDGLCAIHDFLTIVEMEKENSTKDRMRIKGMFVRSFLLIGSGNIEGGKSIFHSIKADMEKFNMHKKLDYAKKCLSYV